MIDPVQFLCLVIRPTLARFKLPPADVLLLGTALTESGLQYLAQIGGPALGPYQCEPATYDDMLRNFMPFHPHLLAQLILLKSPDDPHRQLVYNLAYATAVCRMHYYRAPDPLPPADDPGAMAAYHKRFYNTSQGATDPSQSVEHFRLAIACAANHADVA